MHLKRSILCVAILASATSCTWSPVYRRDAQIVPIIDVNDEPSTVLVQTRARLRDIIGHVAERHGMESCPSLIGRKREVAKYCTTNEGMLYMLTIRATELDGAFLIRIEEPDTTAFFKARESKRFRTIWNDLLLRLRAEWPGCVSEGTM